MISNAPDKIYTKGRLLTFKLNGENELPAYEMPHRLPEPPPRTASSDDESEGNKTYHENCVYCHGPGAVSSPNLKDLRYMDAATHEQFLAIVYGGIHKEEGMPAYDAVLTVEEVEKIHAYLIKAGHAALAEENSNETWASIKSSVYSALAVVTRFFTGMLTWVLKEA